MPEDSLNQHSLNQNARKEAILQKNLLQILPAGSDEKNTIWNMFQFYCYDTSVYDGYDVEADGKYKMCADYFAQYWQLPRWSAFILKVDGALAGFALIEPSDVVAEAQELADLFIMRRFRRLGIARRVVEYFMAQRDIPWTVTTFDDAPDATAFWQQMFRLPQFQVIETLPDPDGRDATVHLLAANQGIAPDGNVVCK